MKLTKEQIEENLACYKQAMETGTVQGIDTHLRHATWIPKDDPYFYPDLIYRRKPTPTIRPWKPEEVPLGAWVRSKSGGSFVGMIIAYDDHSVNCGTYWSSYLKMRTDNEHSIDNGKTWLPCGVEEWR